MTGGASPRARVHFATGDRATLDELATLVKVAQARNLELGATASTLREEVAIVAQAKAALESECATIQTRVTDYDSTVSRSAEQLQQVANALVTRQGAVTVLETELAQREKALVQLQGEIVTQHESVSQAAEQLQQLTGGTEAKALAQLQETLTTLRDELGKTRAAVARVEAGEMPATAEAERNPWEKMATDAPVATLHSRPDDGAAVPAPGGVGCHGGGPTAQHRGALPRPGGQGQAAVVPQVGARAAVHGQQDLAVQRHHP